MAVVVHSTSPRDLQDHYGSNFNYFVHNIHEQDTLKGILPLVVFVAVI